MNDEERIAKYNKLNRTRFQYVKLPFAHQIEAYSREGKCIISSSNGNYSVEMDRGSYSLNANKEFTFEEAISFASNLLKL